MLEKLFRAPAGHISTQAFRYTLAGTAAYTVDYCLLILFVEILGIHYLTASLVAFLAGAATSYILNVKWVFDSRTFNNRYFEIFIFCVIGLVGLAQNQFIIWFFTENTHFHYLVSKLLASIIVFVWNFFARKYILFR